VTNVTISLSSPPIATTIIQTTNIRIHVYDTWVTKNLWYPENKSYWPFQENWKGFFTPMSPLGWLFGAIFAGFGKLSGKVLTDSYYVDIFVTVKPYHAIKIQALPPSKLAPNDITSIPIKVENQGNYNDTFNFRMRTETGYPLTVTNNGSITLQPGEQGQALVGVAVPANILDTGTLHSIFIDAYSAEQPNSSINTQRIFIETQGLYFSEENSAYTIGVGLLFLIGLILLLSWRRKVSEKNGKRPEKPWKIPEEQMHLAELKRTDKNAYERERIMMENEYKSAVKWYNEYRKPLRKKTKVKKPKKKPKAKPKKKLSALLKKPVVKPKEEIVKPVIPVKDTSREKAIERIKKEQEKQLRRLK
jgi:hypothetical protein